MSAVLRLRAALLLLLPLCRAGAQDRPTWSRERARAWGDSTGWLVGSNFVPSTASNQLEMWQAATFDPQTIDRELGWAESLGFNTIRVFLHKRPGVLCKTTRGGEQQSSVVRRFRKETRQQPRGWRVGNPRLSYVN